MFAVIYNLIPLVTAREKQSIRNPHSILQYSPLQATTRGAGGGGGDSLTINTAPSKPNVRVERTTVEGVIKIVQKGKGITLLLTLS